MRRCNHVLRVMMEEIGEISSHRAMTLKFMQQRIPLGKYPLAMRATVLVNKIHAAVVAGDQEDALRWVATYYQVVEEMSFDGGPMQLAWPRTFFLRDHPWFTQTSKASAAEIGARIAKIVADTVGIESSYVKLLTQIKKRATDLSKQKR